MALPLDRISQMTATPSSLGYRMPAEWEPHAATWLAWPHNRDDWPGKFRPIPWVYAEIVRYLVRSEPVNLLVQSEKAAARARKILERAAVPLDRVTFLVVKTDRVWLRDTAPSFLVRKEPGEGTLLGVVDWAFNAWAKYDNFDWDARLPKKIAKRAGLDRWKPSEIVDGQDVRIVLEGGAIDVNGHGMVLATEECLLSDVQARNPLLNRAAIEKAFADYLGCPRTIWLGNGIAGDDTHGHVDDIARFVSPTTIVAAIEDDPSDANYAPLQDNLERLKAARDLKGKALRIVPLPMPKPVIFDGQRLPASYANFYVANSVVLVPTFNDPADREALKVLASVFKDREVVGIHSVDLVWGLGTLHCLSREEPAVEDNKPAIQSVGSTA
jgi:agmatine deiminase